MDVCLFIVGNLGGWEGTSMCILMEHSDHRGNTGYGIPGTIVFVWNHWRWSTRHDVLDETIEMLHANHDILTKIE